MIDDLAAADTRTRARAAALSRASTTGHNHQPAGFWKRNGWLSARNERLSARIFTDRRALQREGVELTQWGPDSVTGKTRIYLTHYSKARAQILYKRFGNGIIVSTISEARAPLTNRGSDTTPFIGGDNLWIPATPTWCTSGPIAQTSAGLFVMITAGHCTAGVGNFIFRSDVSGNENGPHIGNFTDRVNCDGCLDASIVNHDSSGSNYSAKVWGGQPSETSPPQYSEDGTGFPERVGDAGILESGQRRRGPPAAGRNCPNNAPTGCSGDLVTADSAVTGEVRGITVFAVNQTMTFTDGNVTRALSEACSQVVRVGPGGGYVCNDSGPTINTHGDSGGPWIVHEGSSSSVQIAGTTVGGNAHVAYYEQIGDILSKYNLSIP